MSRAPDHHTYYRRVGDTFAPMEAYEVEEMMRLKASPKLEFISELQTEGSAGGNRNFAFRFGLTNTSRVTAKFPYIEYLKQPEGPPVAQHGLDGNGRTLWPQALAASNGILFAAGADQVIHPGQSLFVSKIDMCEADNPKYRRDWGISRLQNGERLLLSFEFGAEDVPASSITIEFTKRDLISFVRPEVL